MPLRSLIAVCLLLALALLYQNRRPYPKPVSSFDPALAISGMAYRFPDNYHPDEIHLFSDYSEDDEEEYKVLPDSILIPASRVSSILTTLLDGINYETQSYFYYKTGEVPDSYSMAMCHTPRFIVEFKNKDGVYSNGFYVCFECGNTSFFNGTTYHKSGMYRTSKEGIVAFKKLQESLFPG